MLSVVGVTLVSVAPPEVYAVPDEFVISFDVEKAVVPAPKVAELVYKAILKVFPVVAVKLCVPTKSSCLKTCTNCRCYCHVLSPMGLLR